MKPNLIRPDGRAERPMRAGRLCAENCGGERGFAYPASSDERVLL
ncbi:hypothetical protein ACLMAJ_18565 [Nocardia sp. KC 131]